jgi:hypothetical protein
MNVLKQYYLELNKLEYSEENILELILKIRGTNNTKHGDEPGFGLLRFIITM